MIQDKCVNYAATSLLCDNNRGPTRAADGGEASAKKLVSKYDIWSGCMHHIAALEQGTIWGV